MLYSPCCTTYPVLCVLILTFRRNILSLKYESSRAVCNSLCQAKEKILSLSVDNIFLANGVKNSVGSLSHSTGSTEQSLAWLQQT